MPFLLLLLLAFFAQAIAQPLRVESLLNPAVTQETIWTTVCIPGWTKRARPPSSYARRIKAALIREFDIPKEMMSQFELDHRIPLGLGGAPSDPANLELQPWDEAVEKDRKEACLARAVCASALALEEARRRIWANWRNVGAGCD